MLQKSIIIILIFTLASFNSKAQYQSIFGQNSTEWVFEWHNNGIDEQDTVYVEKDTVAFGNTWKKILVSRFPDFKGALLREDTSIGKVWYKSLYFYSSGINPSDTIVRLCYDFSLLQSDTFDLKSIYSISGFPSPLNDVDTTYIQNGNKYIEFKLQSIGNSEKVTFIEGVGGTPPPVWKQLKGKFLGQYLLCSYKDGVQTFYFNKLHNGNCNVYAPNSLKEIINLNKLITVYPNPTDNFISFNDLGSIAIREIMFFDITGRKLKTLNPNKLIDLSDLSKGNYFVQFITNNNLRIIKKITKN